MHETLEKRFHAFFYTIRREDVDHTHVVDDGQRLVVVIGRLKAPFILVKDKVPSLRSVLVREPIFRDGFRVGSLNGLPQCLSFEVLVALGSNGAPPP